MFSRNQSRIYGLMLLPALALGITIGATARQGGDHHERDLNETEVPKAALDALRALAGGAKIEEFEEETSNGVVVYEAEWKTQTGEREATVTANGDLVELEEEVAAGSVPNAVTAAAQLAGGNGVTVEYEKKTYILYEAEFRKDGKSREMYISPTGQVHGQEAEDPDTDHDD